MRCAHILFYAAEGGEARSADYKKCRAAHLLKLLAPSSGTNEAQSDSSHVGGFPLPSSLFTSFYFLYAILL